MLESPLGDKIKLTYEGDSRNRRLNIRLLEISKAPEATPPLKIGFRKANTAGILHFQNIVSEKATFKDIEPAQELEIYLYW